MDWNPYESGCPSRQLLDRIGDRWTALVVGVLSEGTLRFTQIMNQVEGISQKMLTQTLRSLERDGLVTRTVYPQVPLRVEYSLTEVGKTLQEPLNALTTWAKANMDHVLIAREAYDMRAANDTVGV